jgi:hypothetical protein
MKLFQNHPSKMSRRRNPMLPGVILLTVLTVVLISGNYALAADAANRQQAIEFALQQNAGAGKVLGVREIKNKNGIVVYAVKVLSDGRVRVISIKKAR